MTYDPGSPGGTPPFPGGQGWSGSQPYSSGYGQPQPPGWGPPPAGGPSGPPPARGNAFTALFDFGFNSFATPGLVRLLYIVGTVLIGLGYVMWVIAGFINQTAIGFVAILIGGILALFWMALLRVMLEFYYAVVRMSEDIHNRR